VTGLALYLFIDDKLFPQIEPGLRAAITTFIAIGSMSFVFSLERYRLQWVGIFCLFWALALAFVAYSTSGSEVGYSYVQKFPLWSGLVSIAIALPLFQTINHHGEIRIPYPDLHSRAWNCFISWCVSWVFVGLSIALAYLVAYLFELIGIDLLVELLKIKVFFYIFMGATFGAALGVLKENQRVIDNIQNLLMTILSILAPVLSASLVLFIIALPFTGLDPFWRATKDTTPILLSCVIGAIVLVNTIIRNRLSEEPTKPLMRYSAMGLALSVLPLAVIALISMQHRVSQYGLTPDRIWGVLATLFAVAVGFVYMWAIVKTWITSQKNWTSNIRDNNIRLAISVCILAFILALPVVNFPQISVSSQLARIQDGRTQLKEIDYVAFAFDFGEPGRRALRQMLNSDKELVVNNARVSLAVKNRWRLAEELRESNSISKPMSLSELVVFPVNVDLPDRLVEAIRLDAGCLGEYCVLYWEAGSESAMFVTSECLNARTHTRGSRNKNMTHDCPAKVIPMVEEKGQWSAANQYQSILPR